MIFQMPSINGTPCTAPVVISTINCAGWPADISNKRRVPGLSTGWATSRPVSAKSTWLSSVHRRSVSAAGADVEATTVTQAAANRRFQRATDFNPGGIIPLSPSNSRRCTPQRIERHGLSRRRHEQDRRKHPEAALLFEWIPPAWTTLLFSARAYLSRSWLSRFVQTTIAFGLTADHAPHAGSCK